ncbi:MAG: hypothetical protein LBM93_08115 [Oscillospiraceae bacterium]|jgi:hypothetical protein|nr:hypothetical protein [Oscillospiraceae bacterium]
MKIIEMFKRKKLLRIFFVLILIFVLNFAAYKICYEIAFEAHFKTNPKTISDAKTEIQEYNNTNNANFNADDLKNIESFYFDENGLLIGQRKVKINE